MKMVKSLLLSSALVAACVAIAPTTASAQYAAIAAGPYGAGWATGAPTMESARARAVSNCRELGGSCSSSVAEDSSWSFAAGYCDGEPYTAASAGTRQDAIDFLYRKAAVDGRSRCRVFKSF